MVWNARSILLTLYLLFGLPTTLIQVYLTPPIQVPDEDNHFLRALQIADGHLFGSKIGVGDAGGTLDPEASRFAHALDELKFDPDRKVDPNIESELAAKQWRSGPRVSTAFPNTAIYPFFLYLPASAGLSIGRHLNLSIMDSLYLGRLLNAATSIALASLALWVCGQGRTLLFVILCLPETLSLFASLSQDALAIAMAALAAALWSRFVTLRAPMPAPVRVVVAFALGTVAAARLPLLPLCVLAVTPTRTTPRNARPQPRDVAAAAAALVPILVGIYGASVAKVPFRAGDGVSPALQVRWILAHPIEALTVLARTVSHGMLPHLQEMIGDLGWLDTTLPRSFYAVAVLAALGALLVGALESERTFVRGWGWLPLGAVALSVAGVFGAFYLAWTPVGATMIEGVQGRYFIAPALVLATSLPGLPATWTHRTTRVVAIARITVCLVIAAADLWVVPTTLIHRYYG